MSFQANPQIFDATYGLSQVIPGYRAGAERVERVMDSTVKEQGNELPKRIETIELRDVSFSYDPSSPILRHVSLVFNAGD